jgi:hypothetical protein
MASRSSAIDWSSSASAPNAPPSKCRPAVQPLFIYPQVVKSIINLDGLAEKKFTSENAEDAEQSY